MHVIFGCGGGGGGVEGVLEVVTDIFFCERKVQVSSELSYVYLDFSKTSLLYLAVTLEIRPETAFTSLYCSPYVPLHTATKIPLMYSFSGNSEASAPISTFMCLSAIYIVPGLVYIFPPAE
jgi:hypothetical protein